MAKRQPLRIPLYLDHIAEAMDRIHSYLAGKQRDEFLQERLTQDAVIRNFEVIGEACHNILKHHPAFAREQAQIPFRVAYDMRNALSHGYYQIDLATVWAAAERDLPAMRSALEELRARWPSEPAA